MKIEGTHTHFNYSPKGGYEALILATAKGPVQVNFERHHAGVLAAALKPGIKVSLKVAPMDDLEAPEHPVYQLQTLHVRGQALELEPQVQIKGTIQRLNYTLHGEVNGALLDTGDFVHLRPHGARALRLAPGQPLRASGQSRPLLFGPHRALEADTVNGLSLDELKHAKKHAKKAAAKKAAAKKAAAKKVASKKVAKKAIQREVTPGVKSPTKKRPR